jgi:hypothetical protein
MSLPDLKLSLAQIQSLPSGVVDWEDIEGSNVWGKADHVKAAASMHDGVGVQPRIIRSHGVIKRTPKYYYVIDSYDRDGTMHWTRIPRGNVRMAMDNTGGRL